MRYKVGPKTGSKWGEITPISRVFSPQLGPDPVIHGVK